MTDTLSIKPHIYMVQKNEYKEYFQCVELPLGFNKQAKNKKKTFNPTLDLTLLQCQHRTYHLVISERH